MIMNNKRVAIVGGGPGGLTLARLLQLQGVEVKVYERDSGPHTRVQGATLDLHHESGLKALKAAGLIEEFRKNYRPGADKLRITDPQARILLDDHEDGIPEAFGDEHFRPEIDRGPLRKLLLNSLQQDTVQWGSHFSSLEALDDGWLLNFHDGRSAYADVVIGADGAGSKVRPYVTPIQPFYSGVTIIEGTVLDAAQTIPMLHALVNGGKVFALGAGQSLILSAKGDGSLSFYTGCRTAEDWVRSSGIDFGRAASVLQWFRQAFSDWDPVWQSMFDNDQVSLVPRPQYCMPVDQTWEAQPNITLLGDAAHLMPPYAGEGVNMALLDALELSECLIGSKFKAMQSAIAHYENHMRERTSAIAQLTLDQTEALHASDSLAYLLNMMGGHQRASD